jgi:hypothetical protein
MIIGMLWQVFSMQRKPAMMKKDDYTMVQVLRENVIGQKHGKGTLENPL